MIAATTRLNVLAPQDGALVLFEFITSGLLGVGVAAEGEVALDYVAYTVPANEYFGHQPL